MSDSNAVELELSTCIWCTNTLHAAEQSVTVSPPRETGSSFHEWELHLECAREWVETVDRVGRLKQLGAGATLLTAAEHDGIETLLSEADLEQLDEESQEECERTESVDPAH